MLHRLKIPLGASLLIVGGVLWLMLTSGVDVRRSATVVVPGTEGKRIDAPLVEPLLPGARPTSASDLTPAGDSATLSVSAEPVAALHGRVTDDEDGRGLPGARIYVEVASLDLRDSWERRTSFRKRILGNGAVPADPIVAWATAGPEGHYSVPLGSIPPGDYTVLARHDTHSSRTTAWIWAPESTELNFQLGPGDSIRGIVLGSKGAPVPGAVVAALVEEERRGWRGWERPPELVDRTETDTAGRFVLSVAPGTFRVTAAAPDLSRSMLDGVESGTTDLEILLEPARSIDGRVIDESGKAVPGATVSLTTRLGEGVGRRGSGQRLPSRMLRILRPTDARAESDEEGRFQFQGLSPNLYLVQAETSGRVPVLADVEVADELEPYALELTLVPGRVLGGVVTDSRGEPVPGALVLVSPDGDGGRRRGGRSRAVSLFRAVAATETGEDGEYAFDTLADETYSLSVQADDFLPHREDKVVPEKTAQVDVILQSGLRLEGVVVAGSDGLPVAGARLLFRVSREDRRSVATDDYGRYGLSGLSAGRIDDVQVSAEGFALHMVEEFDLVEGPEVQVRDFALASAARLAGVVTDTLRAPVQRARVTVSPVREENTEGGGRRNWRARRRQRIQSTTARTDALGAFAILEANAGSAVRISIEHADFKDFTSETFSLEPGTSLEDLRFELEPGGRLDVTVVDVNGSAVQEANVRVVQPSAEEGRRGRRPGRGTRSTDSEGQVFLRGLEEGDYAVAVSKDGFQTFFSRTTVVAAQISQLGVRLLPENAVTGTVTDRYGAPVENVWIRATGKPGEEALRDESSTRSDATGVFRVGNLGQGPYKLAIRARDFAPQTLEEIAVNTNVSIVLEGLGGISGFVLDAVTGGPVTPFEVRLKTGPAWGEGRGRRWGQRGSGEESRTFNHPQGAFSVGDLSPGDYVLAVTRVDYVGAEVRVTVEDGAVTEGVQVVLVEGVAVVGVVAVLGTGQAVTGAQIFLLPVDAISQPEENAGSAAQRRRARREEQQQRRAGRHERNVGENPEPDADRLHAVAAASLLKAARQNGNASAVTAEDGSFKLQEVPYGEYVLLVNHEAFLPAQQTLFIGEDRTASSMRVDLERGESLEGTIRLADGRAAAGARLYLRGAEGIRKQVRADPDGRFLMSGLLTGDYRFWVRTSVDGQQIRSPAVRLTLDGGATRFDYQLGDP